MYHRNLAGLGDHNHLTSGYRELLQFEDRVIVCLRQYSRGSCALRAGQLGDQIILSWQPHPSLISESTNSPRSLVSLTHSLQAVFQ